MTLTIDDAWLVAVDDVCEEDDTPFLREQRCRGRHHLDRRVAFSHIAHEYVALTVQGLIVLWLFGVVPLRRRTCAWHWIVVGDLPSARLDLGGSPHPRAALQRYVRTLREWTAGHLSAHDAVDFSFVVHATEEWIEELDRRTTFLERELLIPPWEPPCGATLGPMIRLSSIEPAPLDARALHGHTCAVVGHAGRDEADARRVLELLEAGRARPALDIADRCHVLAALLAAEDGADPAEVQAELEHLGLWTQMPPSERRLVGLPTTADRAGQYRHEALVMLLWTLGLGAEVDPSRPQTATHRRYALLAPGLQPRESALDIARRPAIDIVEALDVYEALTGSARAATVLPTGIVEERRLALRWVLGAPINENSDDEACQQA